MKTSGRRTAGAVLTASFVLVCAALYIYIYVIPSVSGALTPTAVAEYGEMQTTNPAKCIVLRSESAISSGQSGNTGYYVEEGEKTRTGVKVASVYQSDGSAQGYFMQATAVVSYWYDGLEGTFSPDALEDITPESYAVWEEDGEQLPAARQIKKEYVAAGEPLYKVISSDVWYMALYVEDAYMDRYSMNGSVKVDFGDKVIDAEVVRMTQFEDGWVVVLSTRRYYEEYAALRYCDVSIITQDSTGLLVPTSSIAVKEQEDGSLREGVYLKNIKGDYNFIPVKVLAESEAEGVTLIAAGSFNEKAADGSISKVYTVEVYDEILRSAEGLSDVNVSEEIPEEEEEIVFEWEKKPQEPPAAAPSEGEGPSGTQQEDAGS